MRSNKGRNIRGCSRVEPRELAIDECRSPRAGDGASVGGTDGGSGAKVPYVRGLGRNTPGPEDGTGSSGGIGTYVMG